jgi:phage tail protein X
MPQTGAGQFPHPGEVPMTLSIITSDGDMLDAICKRRYGRESVVPLVLDANPHLAKQPATLPAGLVVVLPDVPETPEVDPPEIRLWG